MSMYMNDHQDFKQRGVRWHRDSPPRNQQVHQHVHVPFAFIYILPLPPFPFPPTAQRLSCMKPWLWLCVMCVWCCYPISWISISSLGHPNAIDEAYIYIGLKMSCVVDTPSNWLLGDVVHWLFMNEWTYEPYLWFIGKFQMQVLSGCGHAVHEDVPDKVCGLEVAVSV